MSQYVNWFCCILFSLQFKSESSSAMCKVITFLTLSFFFFISAVDKCELGLDDCAENADCVSTQYGHHCECQTGFSGHCTQCQGNIDSHVISM